MNGTETAVGLVMEATATAVGSLTGSTDTTGAARYLGLGVSTLEKLRVNGGAQFLTSSRMGRMAA